MGGHERHKSQLSEVLISDALNYNGNTIRELVDENYVELSEIIVDRIKQDYDVLSSKQIGDEYDSIGDVRLETDDGVVFVEIKITESGGTLGNITQDALTKYGIVKNAKSWSEYRSQDLNHYGWVRNYLNKYDYPSDIRDDDTKTSIYEKASYLKSKIECGRRNTENVADEIIENSTDQDRIEAAELIKSIISRAKKEKLEYINYIEDKPVNEKKLRRFSYLLLSGYATTDAIEKRIDMLLEEIAEYDASEYVVYNGYKSDLSVEKQNKEDRVEILFEDEVISLDFPDGQYGFNIKKSDDTIIRGQFHWKNKFNGIETPCLNLFKEY